MNNYYLFNIVTQWLYDYEKSISEKVSNISSLEKQITSLSGDDSEETISKVQQLRVDLEEAKQDLQETEYEQALSDAQTLMDNLYSEYEELLNSRLDDLNFIMTEMIDTANANADSIKSTLTEATNAVGVTLSDQMNTVWTSGTGLSSIVTNYGNTFDSALTTTNKALSSIQALVQAMVTEAQKKVASQAASQAANTAKATGTTTVNTQPVSTNNTATASNNSSSSGTDFFVYKKDSYPKSKLNKDNSIVDFS